MFAEFLKACFFIFMAEMGDKTQILALAFATKYNVKSVLLGVFIGSLLNHGVAVFVGAYLSSIIPLDTIRLVASSLFIGFGLWSLKGEGEDEEGGIKEKFGPVATVALAFFIGELGDKTQLTAITLSTTAGYPAFILMGTVTGMIITSGIGIFVGSKLGKRIPEFAMKLAASAIFIFFGVFGLYGAVPDQYITLPNVLIFAFVLTILVSYLAYSTLKTMKRETSTALKRVAVKLNESVKNIKPSVESVCLGVQNCGSCHGQKCSIGTAKDIIECAIAKGDFNVEKMIDNKSYVIKGFDEEKSKKALSTVVENCLNCGKEHDENCVVNRVRELFEMQCYGRKIPFKGDTEEYKKQKH